jgi:hypothetical protein
MGPGRARFLILGEEIMAKRIKKMPKEQFVEVMKRDWAPVKLESGAIPDWMNGIPHSVLNSVYASGGPFPGLPYPDSNIPSARLLGGIDVYRNAPGDPVDYNKDWYAVLAVSGADSMLLIRGPIFDADHWLDQIPDRLQNVEILAVPPPVTVVYADESEDDEA